MDTFRLRGTIVPESLLSFLKRIRPRKPCKLVKLLPTVPYIVKELNDRHWSLSQHIAQTQVVPEAIVKEMF